MSARSNEPPLFVAAVDVIISAIRVDQTGAGSADGLFRGLRSAVLLAGQNSQAVAEERFVVLRLTFGRPGLYAPSRLGLSLEAVF